MLRFAIAVVAIVLLAGCGGPAASPADTPAATTEAPTTAATPTTTTETPTPDPPTTAPTPEVVTKTVVVTKTATVTPTPTPTPTPEPELADLVTVDRTLFGRDPSNDSDEMDAYRFTIWIENDNEHAVDVAYWPTVEYTDDGGRRQTLSDNVAEFGERAVTIPGEETAEIDINFKWPDHLRDPDESVAIRRVEGD